MEQIAKIIKVNHDGTAEIEVRRQSACGHDCGSCHGCGAPDEHIQVTAINEAKAAEGDYVRISSDTKRILGLVFLLYLLPLLLFFIGYLFFGTFTGLSNGLNGAIGFFIGIALVYLENHRMKKSKEVAFTVTSVLRD